LLAATLLVTVGAQRPQDLITSLPLYDGPLGMQYSGYININATTGKSLHYWFIQSFNQPATDPLVLWLNGGPGCSSMDGLFYEQGPIHFSREGEDLNLHFNRWTWTNISNMIFLEAPAGVGFSYSNDPADYSTNDQQTALDNYHFLQNWFKAFPKFAKNPFWISGESYAGIYVPMLANLVSQDSTMNFQGIMVGNGVTDYNYDAFALSLLPFAYGHGLISSTIYQAIQQFCFGSKPDQQKCQAAFNVVSEDFSDIDIYDVYGECFHQRPSPVLELTPFPAAELTQHVGVVPPCIDSNKAISYLNMQSVQQAIHVQPVNWTICSDILNYTSTVNTVIPIYEKLMAGNFHILVYSGDTDGAVPFVGTTAWLASLNMTISGRDWEPWYYTSWDGDQVGGFVTEYQGITFTTVRGSGHMVPQFRPEAAFNMFQRFVQGHPL